MSATAIKVNRLALVARLKEVKANKESEFAKLLKDWADYKSNNDKWLEGSKKHIVNIWNNYGQEFRVDIDPAYLSKKPKEPTNPSNYVQHGRQGSYTLNQKSKEELSELTATINLLELSNEDTVGQTLLKNVAKFLG
jgi:hypothetical protein